MYQISSKFTENFKSVPCTRDKKNYQNATNVSFVATLTVTTAVYQVESSHLKIYGNFIKSSFYLICRCSICKKRAFSYSNTITKMKAFLCFLTTVALASCVPESCYSCLAPADTTGPGGPVWTRTEKWRHFLVLL